MKLEQMRVAIRPRSAWEAIDLGFAMARHWFLPLYLLWWCAALPIYLLATLLFGDSTLLIFLMIWWCKPLYEPPLTYWISRALFDQPPPLREVFNRWPRIIAPRLFANLTWNRFNLNRSFHLPVPLLEGLTGRQRKARMRILGRHSKGGGWLTVVGYHLESILMFSLLLLLLTLIPEEIQWISWDQLLFGDGRIEQTLQEVAYLIAMSIIAPFYVAAGFSLYLTRRTELEGWDIELHFRRIAARHQPATPRSAPMRLLPLLLLPLLLGNAPPAAAYPSPEQAQETIQQVLASDDFGSLQQEGYWHYVGEQQQREPGPFARLLKPLFDNLAAAFKAVATLAELLFWLAAGFALALLGYWIYRNREWLQRILPQRQRQRAAPPSQLFGLDLTPATLPDDPAQEALRLLDDGHHRAALSLLYRAALTLLLHHYQLDIPASATENESLLQVQQCRPEAEAALFQRLTHAWIRLAWGHLTPHPEELRTLCNGWQQHYGTPWSLLPQQLSSQEQP